MPNDQVIPFFEKQNVPMLRILTDRGTEYCGSSADHEYVLYLGINEIEHTRPKVRSPQTYGICERFYKTMLQKSYQIACGKKLYESIERLQHDVDRWIESYNEERPH